jgi:NADP-dependent 3-hydroxy acid dehydrogenase YdfG
VTTGLRHYAALEQSSVARPSRSSLTDLKDQVVLITGASAGIGAACAWRFADHGAKLVLVGRRQQRLTELKQALLSEYPALKIHTVAMSVTDMAKVEALPNDLPAEFREVDILVNNAGLARGVTSVENNDMKDAIEVMETNVLGTIAFCRAFVPGMKERGRGHVVNMGSVAGYHAYVSGSVYNASKFAVLGFTNAARHDLAATPIRVTHISPGLVGETEFSNVRLRDDSKAAAVYADIVALRPDDVADNVIYAVTRPKNVQIAEVIMYATNQSGPRDIARVGPSLGAPQKN